jgi:uncharacterized protein YndB with AHSA1/START domain
MSQKNKTTLKAEPGQLDTTLTREFDAPRELVFKVLTDGNAIPKYWNEDSHVEQFDARTGGSWSVVVRPKNGWEQKFHGVYHDVTSPERIVRTFEMMQGKTVLETYTLKDLGGRTKMTIQSIHQSVADRDTIIGYDFARYACESHDRLETLLKNSMK